MSSTFTVAAADHKISSVTVFKSSKAEIVRSFSLQLKKGQNKVEIRGLSSSIDTHSVRVSGLGNARLFDVVCTLDSTAEGDTSSELVRTLAVKKGALQSEKTVREQESHILLQYAQTLSGEHVTPVQMSQFLESYVTQGRKIVEAIVALDEEILSIDRLYETEKKKASLKKGSTNGAVDIVIFADEDDAVELKITYIVSNAQWKPAYEFHASTENGKPSSTVKLHYRARVTQETGEDWKNTSLTLSTVMSDTIIKSIPQLKQRKIRPKARGLFGSTLFGQPVKVVQPLATVSSQAFGASTPVLFGASAPQQQQQQQQSAENSFGSGTALFGQPGDGRGSIFGGSSQAAPQAAESKTTGSQAQEDTTSDDDFEEVDNASPITENKTVVSETPVAVSFSVQGDSTIPSDGIQHQVSVADLTPSAKISYITIPRADARVFLQCEVTNGSEYRLLPGPVTVIYDNSYVSKTSINKDISTGDTFECTLGDDAATKVTYERTSKTVKSDGGSFSEATNTTTYKTKITVHNKHQFAISDLIIRDSVPTCEDRRAKVILRKPAGLAEAKDGESVDLKNQGLRVQWEPVVDDKGGYKEGKFEWKWNVNTGAKAVVEAEWDVKSTGDTEWIEGF